MAPNVAFGSSISQKFISFIFEIYFTVIVLPDFDVHMELCSLDTLLFEVATNLLTLTLVAAVAPESEGFVWAAEECSIGCKMKLCPVGSA